MGHLIRSSLIDDVNLILADLFLLSEAVSVLEAPSMTFLSLALHCTRIKRNISFHLAQPLDREEEEGSDQHRKVRLAGWTQLDLFFELHASFII